MKEEEKKKLEEAEDNMVEKSKQIFRNVRIGKMV